MSFVKLVQVVFVSSVGDFTEGVILGSKRPNTLFYFFLVGFKSPLILTPINLDPRSATDRDRWHPWIYGHRTHKQRIPFFRLRCLLLWSLTFRNCLRCEPY